MKALALTDKKRLSIIEMRDPVPGRNDVLIRVDAVGLCGTDFHIFEGEANYNFDAHGRQLPLSEHPQILGHEMCGTVVDTGIDVRGLSAGDRVVVDQGINCASRGRKAAERCEYCQTGASHQCIDYQELGITGRQGGLADLVSVPAVNAIRISGNISSEEAALAEPLGCIIHASEMQLRSTARYSFGGESPIRSVLICGAGPAGLLFIQYLRNVVGFDGLLIAVEPNPGRRTLAAEFGATVIDPESFEVISAVRELTKGEGVNYLIEAAGSADFFLKIPALLKKQGTLMMYGHGHHGQSLGVMNLIQFLEPAIISPCGASGEIALDGTPMTTSRSLDLLEHGVIKVAPFVTHRYRNLEEVPKAFEQDRFSSDYTKGVSLRA